MLNVRSVVQPSTSMIVSDTYEKSRASSCVDSDAHGRLTNDRRGRKMKLNPAPISQYPSSTPLGNETYAKLLRDFTHGPSDYYNVRLLIIQLRIFKPIDMMPQPPNSRSDDSQVCHAGTVYSPTSAAPDIDGANLNLPSVYQGHLEESGLLAAGPSQFKPFFDGRDPSPTEGSILPLGSLFDPVRHTNFCVNVPLMNDVCIVCIHLIFASTYLPSSGLWT